MPPIISSRREFLQALTGGAAGLTFTWRAAGQAAATQPAPAPLRVTKLSNDFALLAGDGGNVAVILAPDGLMLIDGGLAARSDDLQKSVTEVDSHKIQILFNTHFHFDHTGSNEALGANGARIIAHENVKTRLSQRIVSEAMGRTFEPLKPAGLPAETFTKGGKLNFGKQKLEYTHFPTAHTDGDSYVFLPELNILHTGDLLWNGIYPVIDYSASGWIGGMVAACDALSKVGDAKTQIIPGHGPLASKDDLKASREMLVTVMERMTPMAKQGKTLAEVAAAAPTKDLDDKWNKGRVPDNFLRQAYNSILHHSNNT